MITEPKLLDFIDKNRQKIDANKWEEIYDSAEYYNLPTKLCGKFTEIIREAGIEHLPHIHGIPAAYLNSSDITEIYIPDECDYIGRQAFEFCEKLEIVAGCRNVHSIHSFAFYDCENLFKITLYPVLEEIRINAFGECPSLKIITFMGTRQQWGSIEKDAIGLHDCVIHCLDGDIQVS